MAFYIRICSYNITLRSIEEAGTVGQVSWFVILQLLYNIIVYIFISVSALSFWNSQEPTKCFYSENYIWLYNKYTHK